MSEQHLATEYTVCQYHIQTIDMRLWQSGAILIGASFASMAVLAREEASTALCIAVCLASLAAITIFTLWTQLWRRRDATVETIETRMREIEAMTSMRKVTYMHVLRHWPDRERRDEWKRLSPEEQSSLAHLYKPLPSAGASHFIYLAALLALAGWPALAIGKLVELAMQ